MTRSCHPVACSLMEDCCVNGYSLMKCSSSELRERKLRASWEPERVCVCDSICATVEEVTAKASWEATGKDP